MNYPETSYTPRVLRNNSSKGRKIMVALFVIVFLFITFSVGRLVGRKEGDVKVVSEPISDEYGSVVGKSHEIPEFFRRDVDFGLFWQVWEKIQTEYVDRPVPEPQLLYGALMGLVAATQDPYSVFLEPELSEDLREELNGRFEGIGTEIAIKNNRLTIVSPLPGSPAEKAGLRPGDIILFVDDFDTQGVSLSESVRRIRGEKGSKVVLTVYRDGDSEERKITIVRDMIKIISASLEYEQRNGKKIAVIDLSHFNQDTDSRLVKAINEILMADVDGIVLDLRGNPGGYIDQAIAVSSHWVSPGLPVVTEEYAGDEFVPHLANGNAELKDFKTMVLINGGSASASEIVSGALQDHGLATIIGEQSFGKGSVQNLEQLKDGSSIKLTVARWLTPDGLQIDEKGITPDIEVELTEEDWNSNEDPQLEKALELLVK